MQVRFAFARGLLRIFGFTLDTTKPHDAHHASEVRFCTRREGIYERKIRSTTMTMLRVGDTVPEFSSVTQDGRPFTKADLLGQRTILYFYPKDNTSGCTLEAVSLRDSKARLEAMGLRIVGVSPDSERSHRNFCAKHALNFTLLADTDRSLCEAFGVWAEKSMYGRKYMGVLRTTFIVDAEGRIEKVFAKVDTKNHGRQIAEACEQAE